jgi:hypothetical protein
LDIDEVLELLPEQNGGTSAQKIASLCRNVLREQQSLVKQAIATD